MNVPEDLRYSSDHEWARIADDQRRVRVGVTDFAQEALGDVVFVDLPDVGTRVQPNEPVGELESTKSVSELYAPVGGVIVAVNSQLSEHPEFVNSDPYGEGWLCEIEIDESADLKQLLEPAAYAALTAG